MDSVRDFLSTRRPLFATWTFGRRQYYSPLVHAMAARLDHAAAAEVAADRGDAAAPRAPAILPVVAKVPDPTADVAGLLVP